MSEMQKGEKCSKERGKRAEKKSEHDRDRSNFILSCQGCSDQEVLWRVLTQTSPVTAVNFMFLWTNPVRNRDNLLIQNATA